MFTGQKSKNLSCIGILAIVLGLTGCSLSQSDRVVSAQEETKLKVVATHNLLCNFVEIIAEDRIDLTCLMDEGQEPHSYRPTPSARKAIEQAQLILYGGYQLEPRVIELIEATQNPALKVAVYETAVNAPIKTKPHDHEAEEEHHHETEVEEKPDAETQQLEPDPHVWHNVGNALSIVETIQSSLLQADPDNSPTYLQNSVELSDKIAKLNAWVQEQIATIPEGKKILVTTHESFNYYVQAYEFDGYKTLQGLSSDESPTAAQLRDLAAQIRKTGVPTIFAETSANDRTIGNVAREANVKLAPEKLLADGLGKPNTPTSTYIGMINYNTCAIVRGLGGKCLPFAEK
jgi:manganese/iron transport system substrate-binding protein